MLPIPSALEIANDLIKNNPDNFTDSFKTISLLTSAMALYRQQCECYKNQELDKWDEEESNIDPIFQNIFKHMGFQ